MDRCIKAALIQAANVIAPRPSQGRTRDDVRKEMDEIKEAMVQKHVKLINWAAGKGAQVICLQELFNGPYFCAEHDTRWYDFAEKIPDGPTTLEMQRLAKNLGVVLVIPIYEEAETGVYYNAAAVIDADGNLAGKYRKIHIPLIHPGFYEKFYFKPGNLGFPVFDTAVGKIGVYICYDRHFAEGFRILGLNGAWLVFNPSATTEGVSKHLWKLEQPSYAVANGYFIGAINRVGLEKPWEAGRFYGESYFCDPEGKMVAASQSGEDDVVMADLDKDKIREAREKWQFYRDRRPETYGDICRFIP